MSDLDKKYIQHLILSNSNRISLNEPDGKFICMYMNL